MVEVSVNPFDDEYNRVARKILTEGIRRDDRTGTGTIAIFGEMLRFDLRKGFPILTTKKVEFEKIVSELLWFIEGSTDERRLCEIHYQKPRSELVGKRTIWTDNAEADYWKPKAQFEGDLGRVYGAQWRDYRTPVFEDEDHISYKSIDQLANVIKRLQEKPFDRRHIIEAWNPGEVDDMALPPCHKSMQFFVNNFSELTCKFEMRSVDWFLGAPFNIASYALLTHMIAQVTNLAVGELIMSTGDTHIYLNHVEQMQRQLENEPYPAPKLNMNIAPRNIDIFSVRDFALENYQHHAAIRGKMAV